MFELERRVRVTNLENLGQLNIKNETRAMVTSVARSRRSCVHGAHGYAVPYRAYILAVSESNCRRDALATHVRASVTT